MVDGFCFCFVEFIRNCEQGATALIVAAQYDHGEVVELLLERGAQIDRSDNDVRCSCCSPPPSMRRKEMKGGVVTVQRFRRQRAKISPCRSETQICVHLPHFPHFPHFRTHPTPTPPPPPDPRTPAAPLQLLPSLFPRSSIEQVAEL